METSQFKGHTPGPWMTHGRYVVTGNDAGPIDAHNEGDAALIAAAPDLLAEVERLRAENSKLRADLDTLAASISDVARTKLSAILNDPPAQMSYDGRLVPINSAGMREVIDDATRLRAQLTELREAAARVLDCQRESDATALLFRLDAACQDLRAALAKGE